MSTLRILLSRISRRLPRHDLLYAVRRRLHEMHEQCRDVVNRLTGPQAELPFGLFDLGELGERIDDLFDDPSALIGIFGKDLYAVSPAMSVGLKG